MSESRLHREADAWDEKRMHLMSGLNLTPLEIHHELKQNPYRKQDAR